MLNMFGKVSVNECLIVLMVVSKQEIFVTFFHSKIYLDKDDFLLCFSIVDHPSFEKIRTKWYPEVSHYCPHTLVFLACMILFSK
jgi:hypothetical protein